MKDGRNERWIEHHKRILQKAASALLAFMVSVYNCLYSSSNLPKDRLSLSRMQKTASNLLRLLKSRNLLSLDLAGKKEDAKLGDFVCIRQKNLEKHFTRKIQFTDWLLQTIGLLCGDSSLYHRISKAGWYLLFELDSGFALIDIRQKTWLADFTGYQLLDGKKEKGTAVKMSWKIRSSILLVLCKGQWSLTSYQVTDGLSL